MRRAVDLPPISICVLTYGDYPHLARRCLESIRAFCDRSRYRLIVGANCVCAETSGYLQDLYHSAHIDHLLVSRKNLNKCPMMRRMFALVDTEFVWWFDDDAYLIGPKALSRLLRTAHQSRPTAVMWGAQYYCNHPPTSREMPDLVEFVRRASWYRGLTPPSWAPGGKGELNFRGQGSGDGRWFFITGGCWLARTAALRALDWPDRRLIIRNDDVMLGEALRQQGWEHRHVDLPGLVIHGAPRRGTAAGETAAPLRTRRTCRQG